MTGIAAQFAEFALALKFEDLPAAVVSAARHGIMDLLGVALIGSADVSTRMLRESVAAADGGGMATLLGCNYRALPERCALVNGYAAHALDYDDTQHNCNTHMSAPVLGAAFALGETLHRSGKELLTAYVAGFEIGCRLGRVDRFGRHLQQHGIHPTGFLGHFGAVIAAARLLGLDVMQTRRSLGIAATLASGITRSFGTMSKPLNAANAARNAIVAATLAQRGFTGPDDIFDGKESVHALFDAQANRVELIRDLGSHFEVTHNTLKVFACAGWRNPILEAAIALASDQNLKPTDIASVVVHASADQTRLPNYAMPRNGLEAKFSAEYAAAVALADRAGGIRQFSDERLADARLLDLCNRTTLCTDKEIEPYQIRVRVRTVDGQELERFIPAQKGDPRNPLDWNDLVAKFSANASAVLQSRRIEQLTRELAQIEAVDDVSDLMRLCGPSDV